ncbi:uncharacterized protein LOC126552321 [Aphis gossypii]|uniref:uncharacterized protein LOC126552321 n=1 Tax=Aphis gossypii TaxID=80765 RepID=UPI00215974CE|nr:uncharacterized protein LOC126552321 [Aphis gossypii]
MFPQVTVKKCPICSGYIVSNQMPEHLKKHSQEYQLKKNENISKPNKKTNLFDEFCTETSQEHQLQQNDINMPKANKRKISLFDEFCTETSQDQLEKNDSNVSKLNNKTDSIDEICTETSTNEKRVTNWTKSETLSLIEAYENNISIFECNSKKNRTGWIQVSKDLKKKQIEYTEDQCQGKFKYLLLCYKKKLDNRHKTGSANYEFDYFDELDGLFGRKPNIKSKYLASSSRIYNGLNEKGIFNEDNVSASTLHTSNTPPEAKKQKKKNPSVHEAAIQKRHDEKMAMSQLALDTY